MSLGSYLLEQGSLTQADLDRAVAEHRASGERLDKVLLRMGLSTRPQVLSALGEQFHLPIVDIASLEVDPATLSLLPSKLVFKQRCVPIRM